MRLAGKVAVITGAGGGQGKAAALLFAREGAKVVVNDLGEAAVQAVVQEIGAAGGEATAAPADLAQRGPAEGVVDAAFDTYGRLDVLYNNAGIFLWGRGDGLLADVEEDVFDRVFAVNLKSMYYTCRRAIPRMIEQGGGVIINTASTAALNGTDRAHAYNASKGAVVALTRSIAVGYGRRNIRANCICPGAVESPMTEVFLTTPEAKQRAATPMPLRRMGTAEDVANLALYLASDDAEWMTGSVIPIDGGFTAR